VKTVKTGINGWLVGAIFTLLSPLSPITKKGENMKYLDITSFHKVNFTLSPFSPLLNINTNLMPAG